MNTIVVDARRIRIPAWVGDLRSFRSWFHSEEFPESGKICYLNGEVWVDMSKEQIFSHNQVKGEFTFVLIGLAKKGRLGCFFPDGLLLSNEDANLSAQPDGVFASRETLRARGVRLLEGALEGYVEMEGTPDMVLEIISTSSVEKDTVTLRDLYWQAGIREYWLVDARGERLQFEILRHAPTGYVSTRKQAGWLKSTVFGKLFRLTRQRNEQGNPEYTLAVR